MLQLNLQKRHFMCSVVLFQPSPLVLTSDGVEQRYLWFQFCYSIWCHLSFYNQMAFGPFLNSSNGFITAVVGDTQPVIFATWL